MSHKVTIVALARYRDIFAYFVNQLHSKVDPSIRKILVRDGNEIKSAQGWEIIQGADTFSMAANHNIGWKAVEPDSDILNLNDDIYFLESDPVAKFQQLVYSEPRIGAVAARVKVGFFGNPIQCKPRQDVPLSFVKTCSNGVTYFPREMIEEVGYCDEDFNEPYGAEDADYTHRINLAGWKVAIARDIPVKHGYGRDLSTSTSRRSQGIESIVRTNKQAIERFTRKHGHFDVHGYKEWAEITSQQQS